MQTLTWQNKAPNKTLVKGIPNVTESFTLGMPRSSALNLAGDHDCLAGFIYV